MLFRRLGWDAADYQAWSDDQLAAQHAFVTPTCVGRRDGAALVHRQPADDGRRPRRHRRQPRRRPAPWLTSSTCVVAAPAAWRRWTPSGASSPAVGSPSPTGSSALSARGDPPPADADDRRRRLPRHARARQHPPPPVPEPHPGLPADDGQAAVRLAAVAVPAVGGRSTPRRRTCRRGSAWPSWRCPAARRRPTTSTSTRSGAGDLLAAEIDAAADLGMRFHPTRGSMSLSEKDGGLPPDDVVADDDEILAASEDAVAPPPRPRARRDDADRAGAVLAVHRHRAADGPLGRARRAPRRSPAHPLRRERRGRRLLAGDVRMPADGVPRAHRLVHRPGLAGPLRDARRRRGAPPRRRRRRRRPLPVEQPDPRLGHRARRRPARGRASPSASASTARRRPTRLAVARGPPGDAAGQAARRRRVGDGADRRWRWRRSAARRASGARASSACWRPVPSATWPCGRSTARRSPAPSPTRSRPGCAAARLSARDTVVHGQAVVRGRRHRPPRARRAPAPPTASSPARMPGALTAHVGDRRQTGRPWSGRSTASSARPSMPSCRSSPAPPIAIRPWRRHRRAPSASVAASPAIEPTTAVPVDRRVGRHGRRLDHGRLDGRRSSCGFAALGLDDVEIDAESGRRMVARRHDARPGLSAVTVIAGDDPPDLWVIALGTNDVANYARRRVRDRRSPSCSPPCPPTPRWCGSTPTSTTFRSESAAFNRLAARRARRAWPGDGGRLGGASPPRRACCSDGVHPTGVRRRPVRRPHRQRRRRLDDRARR